MSNLMADSFCPVCHKIKPSSEFEQSTKIQLPTDRLPWLKDMLSEFKEIGRFCMEEDPERELEPDEETIASYKSDLRTADDILRIIDNKGLLDRNTAERLKPYSVEIPINDYQRKWLKDTLRLQMAIWQANCRDAKERKHERAAADMNIEIATIEFFLKIIDMSSKQVCRNCCMMYGGF
jgi:hypothetical protein